jgi:small nuclear ribonucleoprotein (snRNP)-like protein
VGKTVVVELKNDLCIRGTLHSVDQYLNLKLTDITVLDENKYPHMVRRPHPPRRRACACTRGIPAPH